jgi:hypothetical protein
MSTIQGNAVQVKEHYTLNCNRFATFWELEKNVDINRTWKKIVESVTISSYVAVN